jgi:large subunit ribosomal protein L9
MKKQVFLSIFISLLSNYIIGLQLPHYLCKFRRNKLETFFLQATTKPSSDKIRVKLLNESKNIGKKGEIVFVSPAMWLNVLSPKKLAEKISDEEMLRLESEQNKNSNQELLYARQIESKILSLKDFKIERKVGVNNQLFGSVTTKHIVEELKDFLQISNNNLLWTITDVFEIQNASDATASSDEEVQKSKKNFNNNNNINNKNLEENSDNTLVENKIENKIVDLKNKIEVKVGHNNEIRKAGLYKVFIKLYNKLDAVFFYFQIVHEVKK